MTPERWQQVERVCQLLLDEAPDKRPALLDRECAGDADLRGDVESLLAAQAEADRLLETPALRHAPIAAGAPSATRPPRFTPGTRLGPFELGALIAAGGMGEVYRARDTRLGRTVALKVLPHDDAADPDRRRRMEAEARAVSLLNHPNICALYDIGTDGGTGYLVMEYLEGETLAARLSRGRAAGESASSGLPFAEALEIGAQIADGLAAAHRAGVIHRDLKPGNVMLTPGGVKLLDFGLAKTSPEFEGAASVADGRPRPRTVSGVVMGTVNYMAPERLHGKPADARSDLFAFGALLFEMLTGRRAFEGSSPLTVIIGILQRDPPALADLQPLAPPALDRLVRGCLAKDPAERWDSALLAAQELRRIGLGERAPMPAVGNEPVPRQAPDAEPRLDRHPPADTGSYVGSLIRRRWVRGSAAAALLVPAAAVAWWSLTPAPTPGRLQRFDLDLGRRFTPHPRTGQVLLSPDGTRIVFAGVGADGEPDLFVRRLDRADSTPLGTGGGEDLFFSPDGRWLGYFFKSRLLKVPVAGGRPVELCTVPEATAGGAHWSDGGFIVAALGPNGVLARIPETGGEPSALTAPGVERQEVTGRWPQVLEGSEAVIFSRPPPVGESEGGAIEGVWLGTGRRATLARDAAFGRFLASGHLLFVRRGTLYAAPMDATRLTLSGASVPVLGPVAFDETSGSLPFSVSAAGHAVLLTGEWPWRPPLGTSARDAAPRPAATLLLGFLNELERLAPPPR
jgi:serine/threonine-protein kinase